MPVFNADEYLATLEHPTVVLNGKTYVGRILSINEYLPFAQRIESSANGTTSENTVEFARDYLMAVFPVKPVPFWRPDLREDDPVPQLLNHPGLLPLIESFLSLQARAMKGPTSVPKEQWMTGTISPSNQSPDMT